MSSPRRATASALTTAQLTVGYRRRRAPDHAVLAGLDLALAPGALTCLLGPNGSGKSTLLRTLVGMQRPLAGQVRLGGDDVGRLAAVERARRLAVVLTDHVDAGLLTGADLVALGRSPHTGWSGRLHARDRAAVAWALAATRADDLAERRVLELSDGERQRLLIARALAQQPQVLALDEAVAFVDVARRVELTALLRDLAHECDLAVLVTTHDVDLALRTADEVWLLQPAEEQPGALVDGAPEDLVLSGAVAAAFATDEVSFDLERGGFAPRRTGLVAVAVVAGGTAAVWARRAVEREGLRVAAPVEPAAATLTAPTEPGGCWRLEAHEWFSDHATLGAAAAALRRLVPHLAGASEGGRPIETE